MAPLLVLMILCSCSSKKVAEGSLPPDTITLDYYTIGSPDADLQQVSGAINKILAEKLGIAISYNKIGWQDYEDKLRSLAASGSFDVAFANNYSELARQGAFLALDPYLASEGRQMAELIDPVLWQGARAIDGLIYGVPTNKELSVQEHWMYAKELVDKYKIDITKLTTFESLEPYLKIIKELEPLYQPMEMDKNTNNFFALHGYEYVVDKTIPIVVNPSVLPFKAENAFETEACLSIMKTMRKYYLAGYINEDAALKVSEDLEQGKLVFWRQASGGIFSANSWSRDRGYKVVSYAVTPPVVTTEHTQGGVMSVSAQTRHPRESVLFLNALNTDPEIRNLFNYGIEGVHYTLDDNGQVEQIFPLRYSGVQYTQGNWFILKTLAGEPLDKWEQYKAQNSKAAKSPLLGFTADFSKCEPIISNIKIAAEKYYSILITGSVDAETVLPMFLEELEEAGISKALEEVQEQLDEWSRIHIK
ncbi:MAG: ABC transporter substrate-binding protein [Clostridiales bacterium]|nr:ABC transporter substrate-binding protein [Clostridiales bacterium]